MTPPGFAILGDSAFVKNPNVTNGKVLRDRETDETHDIPQSTALTAVELLMRRVMPSQRQSLEWSVGCASSEGALLALKNITSGRLDEAWTYPSNLCAHVQLSYTQCWSEPDSFDLLPAAEPNLKTTTTFDNLFPPLNQLHLF